MIQMVPGKLGNAKQSNRPDWVSAETCWDTICLKYTNRFILPSLSPLNIWALPWEKQRLTRGNALALCWWYIWYIYIFIQILRVCAHLTIWKNELWVELAMLLITKNPVVSIFCTNYFSLPDQELYGWELCNWRAVKLEAFVCWTPPTFFSLIHTVSREAFGFCKRILKTKFLLIKLKCLSLYYQENRFAYMWKN